jgi:hypothetical protein
VSTPSHPQAPGDPGSASPSTAEIPVVQPTAVPVSKQLPPHPGATSFGAHAVPAAPAVEAPQPTGPVDFVPGLPGVGTPPPPPPPPAAPTAVQPPVPTWPETLESDEPARERAAKRDRLPQDRGVLVAAGLAVLSLVLLELGLTLDFGLESMWEVVPLWSAFATVAVLVGLVALLAASKGGRAHPGQAWAVGAAGLFGLAAFWLLVVLPSADSDRGFLLTAALGCLGAALWVGAKRD